MAFIYALMLVILEILLFASITQRTGGRLFIIELAVIASVIVFALLALINSGNKKTARFLLQILFLSATANALLLYLALPRSTGILLGIAIGLAGFALAFKITPEREKPKQETKRKRTEVEKQLGPIEEEEPKIIIEEAPKKRKRTAKRKKRKI